MTDEPTHRAALNVRWLEHKGEMLVIFSTPVADWFIPPEFARAFGTVLLEFADRSDGKASAGATKQ
jgi:hypothetical protein